MTDDSPLDVLRRLRAKIERRKPEAERWGKFYDGEQPLLFASPEFQTYTGGLFDDFADNWCQVVVDAAVERMVPTGFRLPDGQMDRSAMEAWRRSESDVEFGLAALESLVAKRSYAMVWRPGGGDTELTFIHPTRAVVDYEPGRRRVRRYGLVIDTYDEYEIATLMSAPDAYVYRYQRLRAGSGGSVVDGGGEWEPRRVGLARSESAHFPSPLGSEVPLVELPNRSRLLGPPHSDIANVAPLQNAVNTLWSHLMTAADQRALPARVITGQHRPTRDILDDDGEVIGEEDLPIDRLRRDKILWLESEGARIAEFSPADLNGFLDVISAAVQHIAAQTRTPPHYLLGQMVNISGDALAAAESGLVAKVQDKQRFFGAALREVMRLEALAAGDVGRAQLLRTGTVVWRDAQFRSEAQYADALTKYKAIGVPDEALWARIPGVEPDEVARWKEMRTDQAASIVGGDLAGLFGVKDDGDEEPQ